MAAITTRQTAGTGATVAGVPLTNAQLDANFINLNTAVVDAAANTAVTPGAYTSTNLTVDSRGRITAATSGAAGGVTSFSAGSTGFTPSTTTTGVVTLSGTLAVASGGTGTTTPALVQGTNVTITGTWPNQTINASSSGTVTAVTGTAPVVSSGGATPAISIPVATTSVSGYLSSTDWTTFNAKQAAGSYLTAEADTLATVTARGATTTVVPTFSNGATINGNTVIAVTDNTNAALRITQLGTGNALLVEDSTNPDASPFVIDASGFVMAGSTVNIDNAQIQTFNGAQTNFRWNAASTGPSSYLKKSRSATIGLYSIVNSGDTLGALRWSGDDGVTFIDGASIIGQVDGTPGTNDMPGRLVFSTTADGASSPTERMRIDKSGNVGIGSAGYLESKLTVGGTYPTSGGYSTGYKTAGTIPSGTTVEFASFASLGYVQAATFTLAKLKHFTASQPSAFDVNATVTSQYGFNVDSNVTGATNNYGFYGNIASGTNRYNLYMAGTAANYLAGALTVASKVTTLAQVETPDVTSLLTTANTYPTSRPSLNLDFANSATLDPRITFTRGTNATYTGSDGLVKNTAGIHSPRFDWDPVTRECKGLLIEEARTNLWTYSNDFNYEGTRCWQSSILANVTVAPDGTYSADKIIENATNNSHNTSLSTAVVSGTTYTFSAYVKAAERTYASFNMNGNNGAFAGSAILVNLTAGTVSIAFGTPITYGITDAGNGWKRVYITQAAIANVTGVPSFGPAISGGEGYTGDGTSGIYIWGAQFEVGAFATSYIPSSVTWTGRASTATYVGSNGLTQTAASGVARYQYNPTNLSVAPFLLLEPAATNLVTYSAQFDNANWGKANLSVAANATTAPDGTTTADKIFEDSTNNQHLITQGLGTVTIGSTYTASVYAKSADTRNLVITSYGESYYALNLSTGALITGNASNTTITQLSNGWWKFSVTFVKSNTNGTFYIGTYTTTHVYTGDNASGIYIWGAQVETGSVATSYIPTVASQVTRIADTSTSAQTTRSADVATMTNSNFSSWYNQTEGTFVLKTDIIQRSSSTTYPRIIAAVGTDYNNDEICIYTVTTGAAAGLPNTAVTTSGIQTFGGYVAVPTTYAWTAAIAYKTNDANSSSNGSLVGNSDTSVTLPICIELRIFGAVRYQPMSSGHIAKLTYYPTRLSNSTLQALTT